MAKYYGEIGFAISTETKPGVWKDQIVTRNYYGDLTRDTRQLQSADKLNDNLTISNELQIVADPFARENFYAMRYAEIAGVKWKITGVEVQYPRLILSIGGLYNG